MVALPRPMLGPKTEKTAARDARTTSQRAELTRSERMELVVASQAGQAILPTQYHVDNMRALEAFIVGGSDALERYVLSLGAD